ncbi:hypothetical protein MHYP_G00254120 [Metynnis hypsauchen]
MRTITAAITYRRITHLYCLPAVVCPVFSSSCSVCVFSQWVLAFEIFIPLVLFFILLGLRQKKPAIPVKEVDMFHNSKQQQNSSQVSIKGRTDSNFSPGIPQDHLTIAP